MFALLSLPLFAYTAWAMMTGEVWVAEGAGARLVRRDVSPGYFWACTTIYAGLALAMATIF